MFRRLRHGVDVFVPSPDRQFSNLAICLSFSLPQIDSLVSAAVSGLFFLWAIPQRQRNAGGYSDGRLKMNTIQTYTGDGEGCVGVGGWGSRDQIKGRWRK